LLYLPFLNGGRLRYENAEENRRRAGRRHKPRLHCVRSGNPADLAFNSGSSSATVIDAELASIVGTVALQGKPEFAVADGANALFVNIETRAPSRASTLASFWSR